MARDFSAAGAFGSATSLVTGTPVTIAGWLNIAAVGTGSLFNISDGSNNNRHFLGPAAAADPTNLNAATVAGGTGGATAVSTGNQLAANTWVHVCGRFTSATLREALAAGGNKGSNATSRSPASFTSLFLAATGAGAAGLRCLAAEWAVWGAILSDADVALLGTSRYSPLLVQLGSLKHHWPLRGDSSPEPDLVGGQTMTLTGTAPQAAHPPGIVYSLAAPATRQAVIYGFGSPIYVNETGTRQAILPTAFLDETVTVVPPSPPPPPTTPAGGAHPGRYAAPKRIILPNGDRVTVASQDQFLRLMDDIVAGLQPQVPEAVEPVEKPTKAQVRRAVKAVKTGRVKLDAAVETLVERFVAEQESVTARKRRPTKGSTIALYRLGPRARDIAAGLAAQQSAIEVATLVEALRQRMQDELDDEEAIMQAMGMLL